MSRSVPEHADYPDLEVGPPKHEAVGAEAVVRTLESTIRTLGPARAARLLLDVNQRDGFDCMSCAWPDPGHRNALEFCENGAKAIAWEATRLTVPREFWARHPLSSLQDATEHGSADRAGSWSPCTSRPGPTGTNPSRGSAPSSSSARD